MYKVLKSERVPERNKQRVKLREPTYLGLICFLEEIPVTMTLIRCLYEQVLATGKQLISRGTDITTWLGTSGSRVLCVCFADLSPSFKDILAVVYLSHRADLTVRLDICRKVCGRQEGIREAWHFLRGFNNCIYSLMAFFGQYCVSHVP